MASWKWPAVANKILSDVPGINTLLNALLKQDPAGTTDAPAGAKRWTDTPEGKQFQNFNGSEWQSVGKLAHDAASVDGHSAATDTTPNTIPVRDANGRIPGDISGTAEKAKEAKELSETLAIGKGGTGGTTAEQARKNLGVAPTSHASSSTDYGIGTERLYGHLKSHDAPDATLTAEAGHAFSPAGAAAMQETLEGQIGDLADVVSANATEQATKDSQQDSAIQQAQTAASNAATAASNAQSTANSAATAASTAQQTATAAQAAAQSAASVASGKVSADFSNVTAAGKATAVGWGVPDYSAGISLSQDVEFTAPSAGLVLTTGTTKTTNDSVYYVNGIEFRLQRTSAANPGSSITVPLGKGDKFKIVWGSTFVKGVFYPLKGA